MEHTKKVLVMTIAAILAGQAWALEITLKPVGTYATGIFDDSAAQIVAYDARSKRLFVTNTGEKTIDVLDARRVTHPIRRVKIGNLPGAPLSVAYHPFHPLLAVACEADSSTDPGTVEFYRVHGSHLGTLHLCSVQVGSLPDMITWTHDGKKLLVVNEAEPTNTMYEAEFELDPNGTPVFEEFVDPEGSISIITLGPGITVRQKAQNATVIDVGFEEFNDAEQELLDKGVRIIGPPVILERDIEVIPADPNDPNSVQQIIIGDPTNIGPQATVAQDLEPEYITISEDDKFAWVTLQENNAIAKIDIEQAKVIEIFGLGTKDHSAMGNGLDASNTDNKINIANWPIQGLYQPDAITTFTIGGERYFIGANEGDARDFEESTVSDVNLSAAAFGDLIDTLLQDPNLIRLKITTAFPAEVDNDGNYTSLVSFGGRSFSIWDVNCSLVFDSGDQFEKITAAKYPKFFNSKDDKSKFDNRSDDKGPEPEGLALGEILGHTIAFIGLERMGGIMVYDISDPHNPRFLDYFNNRDFEQDPESPEAGDLGTEGLVFIPANKSPNYRPLVVTANETSGTTTIFEVCVRLPYHRR